MSDVNKIEEFIEQNCLNQLLELQKKESKSLEIDFNKLDLFSPEIADRLLEQPEPTMEEFRQAIEQFDLPFEKKINVRFINVPESSEVRIRDIRAKHLNIFTVIRGLVRQASDVRPVATMISYECPSCGLKIDLEQFAGIVREPKSCKCGRKGRFLVKDKKLVDTQRIVVEESPEILEGGEQPKRLSVFLRDDLVDPLLQKIITPGSFVQVMGVIKEIPIYTHTGNKSTQFDLIMESNNVMSVETEYEDLEISKEDELKIKDFAKSGNPIERLREAIAPTIYGYDKIKTALVLQLFGGVKKAHPDKTKTRGDIHILLVGDPGTGKSQMLTNIAKISPKSSYVTGKGASGAGLTATVVKDEFLRGWSLEAGSIVLANKGVLCIDEIDKMEKEDRVSMHEALEQQTVSIHKANIHATLRAETSVLAAANPKLGRFDTYSSIQEQINMPSTLINRFDLIFTIRDFPSKEHDAKIAQHILDGHKDPESTRSKIEYIFLRKYIAYAKKNCKPILEDQAIKTISDFYVNLRNLKSSEEEIKPIAISARQLEAIIRLSESCAKIRLSNKVTRDDAESAIRLFEYSLKQVGIDPETGDFDIDRIVTGISALQRSRISSIKEIIKDLESLHSNRIIPVEQIFEKAQASGMERDKVELLIKKMKDSGELFEPKHGMIKRVE